MSLKPLQDIMIDSNRYTAVPVDYDSEEDVVMFDRRDYNQQQIRSRKEYMKMGKITVMVFFVLVLLTYMAAIDTERGARQREFHPVILRTYFVDLMWMTVNFMTLNMVIGVSMLIQSTGRVSCYNDFLYILAHVCFFICLLCDAVFITGFFPRLARNYKNLPGFLLGRALYITTAYIVHMIWSMCYGLYLLSD
jgi:magnesium-transporting ATPase (P-type)